MHRATERGAGGTITPGAMNFRGPRASGRPLASAGPRARKGPIEMILRNQHVRFEDPFFLWRSPNFDRKNC